MKRIRYLASTPFSFKREQATTKFAATYPCPTPYAAKVALIIGGIRAGLAPDILTQQLARTELVVQPWGEGVINTHMVKHYEVPRSDSGGDLPPTYLSSTVVFREYLYYTRGGVDLYVENEVLEWLRPALPGVNSFGKQGSFFTLLSVGPAKNLPNGIDFQGSDFRKDAKWEKVSNFSGATAKPRESTTMSIAMQMVGGGSSYVHFKFTD